MSVRNGFTLVEMLVATALTLVLMGAVITVFGSISAGIADSRSTLEMTDKLRSTAAILQRDLGGVTVTMLPAQRPDAARGYFELIEGPVGDGAGMIRADQVAYKADASGNWDKGDTTVRDFDDILMFTTRSADRPFVGRSAGSTDGTIRSDVAEVAWFLRGNTLYRRVLVVAPGAVVPPNNWQGFYANNDVSVRRVFNSATNQYQLLANSLSDLTKRENRFAHSPQGYPYDARGWGLLGLPTLRECSDPNWIAGGVNPPSVIVHSALADSQPGCKYNFWEQNGAPWRHNLTNPDTGVLNAYSNGQRTDDVVLTNVIGFDVKVWDPGVNMYVDLGYNKDLTPPAAGSTMPQPVFYHWGVPGSGLQGNNSANIYSPRVYDTWSTHYETEGTEPSGLGAGKGVNGLDDDGDGLVDEPDEMLAPPPYLAALRGIQVKIRAFDPDSRQIREVTVIQEFLPK